MIEKFRVQQVVIDLPTEESEPWVRAVLQKCIKQKDPYKTVQTVDRVGVVNRMLSSFQDQIEEVSDPITGQTYSISGVGVAEAIRVHIKRWMLTDNPEFTVNEHGDLVNGDQG